MKNEKKIFNNYLLIIDVLCEDRNFTFIILNY